MIRIGLSIVAIGVGLGAACADLHAQDTGLAGLHAWIRLGGKTCMADHFHDGSGSGPTRAHAQLGAIRAWQDFTAWEYGSRWGRYANAISKSMHCSGGRGNVSCSVSARPCRR